MNGIAELYRLTDVEAGKPSPLMVFPVGDWTSAKYPKLTLDQELADQMIANFEAGVLGTRVPIDVNHDPKSPANGWVDRLYMAPFAWNGLSGEALYADWTPNERGAQAVNEGEYLYDSLEMGDHVDPVSGETYHNVLKAVSLTNRPVLRMMPSVRDAADALRLAEPLELQLSEVSLACDPEDPMKKLMDDGRAWAAAVDEALKGRKGMPSFRALFREAMAKVGAHALAEDDGSPVEPTPADSPAVAAGETGEGQTVTLAEGDAATKGSEPMKTVIDYLKLEESTDEPAVLAAVVRLSEERDAAADERDAAVKRAGEAEAKLSELEQERRAEDVARRLDEALAANEITTGEKATLAEADEAYRDAFLEARKGHTAIDLSERGTGESGELPDDVAMAEQAKALAAKEGISLSEATDRVIAANPDKVKALYAS